MTALDGPRAGEADTQSLQSGTSLQRDVPALVSGTQLHGAQPGSGYVSPPQLVRRADGQVLHLTPLLYAVLEAIDGERDVDGVARLVSNSLGRELHPDDVQMLVEEKLRPLGLVLGADGSQPPMQRSNPL